MYVVSLLRLLRLHDYDERDLIPDAVVPELRYFSLHAHLNLNGSHATCRSTIGFFDYSAKPRRDQQHENLPFCLPTEQRHEASSEANSLLLGRQVVGGDDYSCAPDRPCRNGACCPKATLSCNYGEEYCGKSGTSPNDVCWSNCHAKADCGINAAVPGKKCPLNVCCSRWGFCGMEPDFCAKGKDDENGPTGCQSNCEQPGPKHKAGGQDKVIGYYEAWRHDSVCQGMGFDQIPVKSLTHLYFSFGYITPGDFSIAGMDGLPFRLFSDFTDVKQKNPALKTVIAIGGWTYNDPGPTQKVFSNMVSTQANRAKFIKNLFAFMRQYAFDGVDFDWEYPGAPDRGGIPEDGENFTKFLKQLDDENKRQPLKYIVSFTAPTSYWYLRHFDLKAIDYVDFINVMSYDLHGVWDRDNPIGNNIYGHSNVTEIKRAFDLFWRNNVPARKLNLGLGFYGRSFQLEDPACNKPGCKFKGGASKGGCSGESGILSYREIQEIIKKDRLKPFHDKKAGVKYITYGHDQWVSYDDADTFKQKKELAANLGLGGYLIWAVDQDDNQLSALQAVISPKKLGSLGPEKGKSWADATVPNCYVTGCDGKCDPGFILLSEQNCGTNDKQSQLCCPLSGAPDPKTCQWRGNPHLCNGHCHDDEVMLQMNRWGGGGGYCHDGHKAYCCKSPLAEENQCYWAGMGSSCNTGDVTMTFSGTVLSVAADIAQAILDLVGKPTPLAEMVGEALSDLLEMIEIDTMKLYCCPKEDSKKWQNCNWHGEPGSCFDNHCPDVKAVQLTDSYFGAGETCGWKIERVRVFCCEPAPGQRTFLPVPLANLFENPPSGDNLDTEFDLNVDKTSASGGHDENPNDAAFQFVVLTSPEEIQISLDKRDGSHWDVFNCNDAVSEGEHTVQMVCMDSSENSNCHKIHLGQGVPGTILQMPPGCGPGKYAVAKSMVPSPAHNHSQILPRHLSHLVSKKGVVVYDLTFDYEFRRVPRSLGDTQMRIDFSNQDNYWNEIVAAAATKKRKSKRSLDDVGGNHVRWLEEEFRDDYHLGALSPRHLQERWFGSTIIDWLTRMVKPEIQREFTHSIDETFTAKIVDESWSCTRDNIGYEGHITASALTRMKVATSFGFTLIVTSMIAPLDISKSYLTFYNEGEVTATFTLEAMAKVFYQKEQTILDLPFPGATFHVPGIVTIGPNIHISGSLDASLAVAATFETKISIASWEVRQIIPDDGQSQFKPKEIGNGADLDDSGNFNGLSKPEFFAGVAVQGDVTAKLKVAVEFGVRFHERWSVDPGVASVVGEGLVRVKMGAGSSTEGNCPFTYGMDVGASLYAQAQFFKWKSPQYDIAGPWEKAIINGGTCPALGGPPTRKRRGIPLLDPAVGNNTELTRHTHRLEKKALSKRAGVYGPAFTIPVGKYFCPSEESGDNEGTDCKTIQPDWDNDKYLTDQDDYDDSKKKRRLSPIMQDVGFGLLFNSTAEDHLLARGWLEKRADKKSRLCSEDKGGDGIPIVSIYPSGGELPNAAAYGFEEPNICGNYEFGTPLERRVAGVQYDTEHILEFQLPAIFLRELDKQIFDHTFQHPNPNEVDGKGARKRVSFCRYFLELWSVPEFAINGETATPAQHIANTYPTKNKYSHELVVLEHYINSPVKAKVSATPPLIPLQTPHQLFLSDPIPTHFGAADRTVFIAPTQTWGREDNIVTTSRWHNNVGKGVTQARAILMAIRFLVGSVNYHNDFTIRSYLRAQKDRVGNMFEAVENALPSHRRVVNNVQYDAWQRQDLRRRWNEFMNNKFYLAQAQTMKVINEFLPLLQQVWADDGARTAAEDRPGDDANTLAAKQAKRDLIDDIDALADRVKTLPVWINPFG
ncbi:glycosyl hydrolases family 18-domain-containing protein [Apiosordaria backusii]|uniref:chitinase n=1 Tax=Apiosordaria backusii TaxID=314023 RepID=A0AA40BM95_9PEZI|nr:glycosyl hydrolases family 18-domain-containing protein [Apiosordaria backusii]